MSKDHRQLNHRMIAYTATCKGTEPHKELGNMLHLVPSSYFVILIWCLLFP